ncbi:MAG: pilus assembly protein PilM [Deltaproteobacteria bacterium]|nr:pilus assembly protein PilM [Deltaproteobacteria bacterium]
MVESLGLYFDAHAATLVHMRKGAGGKRTEQLMSFPYPAGDSGDHAREAVAPRIAEYLVMNRIRLKEVWAVIPNEEVVLKKVKLPEAARENLDELLEFEFENYFPFKREDVLLDYLVLTAPKKDRHEFNVLLAALKRARYDFYWNLIDKAGLAPVGLEPPLSARLPMVRRLHRKRRIRFPSVLLIPGTRVWEFEAWFGKNELDWRRIPKNDQETSDQFFAERGRTLVNGAVTGPVETPCIEDPEGAGPDLPEPFQRVDLAETFKEASLLPYSPEAFHAAGAALRGMEWTDFGLNLLAPEKRKKRKMGPVYLLMVLCLIAVLLGVATLASPYLQIKKTLTVLEAKYESLSPQIKTVDEKRAKLERVQKDMEALTRVHQRNTLEVLLQLTPLIPEHSWLQTFDLKNDTINIRGNSTSASELIPLLENSPHFKDVEFISPVVKRGGLENFNITMKVEN